MVRLEECLKVIEDMSARCNHLLVEGAGGVLTPLGKRFCITDFPGEAILVGRNRLGTINHTLLSARTIRPAAIAIMGQKRPDLSSATNAETIRELLARVSVVEIPYLGEKAKSRVPALACRIGPLLERLIGKKRTPP